MLIGLTGHRHAGCNDVADHLVQKYGFVRMAFSDPLYQLLVAVNPAIGPGGSDLRTVVAERGWRAVKESSDVGPRLRRMMLDLGASVRSQFGEWELVDALAARVVALPPGTHVVITDARTPQEEEYITSMSRGVVIRVTRDGSESLAGDPDEQLLSHWMLTVDTADTTEAARKLDNAMQLLDIAPITHL